MIKTSEENPILPFEIYWSNNQETGLRSATLKLNIGFPNKFLGVYEFTEWTYGEKIEVEIEAERKRRFKLDQLRIQLQSIKDIPEKRVEEEKMQKKIEELEVIDTRSMVCLQTLATLRKSPFSLYTVEEFEALPGRVATILTNIASYLNITPEEEKKD